MSEYGRELVLILQQRQQSGVDVDRAVGHRESIWHRIAQSTKLPFDVLKFLVSDDRRSDTIQVSVQSRFVIDGAFLFETRVEQLDFAEQLLVDLAKDEFVVGWLV